MKIRKTVLSTLFLTMATLNVPALAEGTDVNITQSLAAVEVMHQGNKVRIERVQDTENMLDPDFSLTSRPCPPFCIQPMTLGPGVETIGELEILDYLKKSSQDASILVIDSRDGDWPHQGPLQYNTRVLAFSKFHKPPCRAAPNRKIRISAILSSSL